MNTSQNQNDENKNLNGIDESEVHREVNRGDSSDQRSGHITYTPTTDGIYTYSIKDAAQGELPARHRFTILIVLAFIAISIMLSGILIGFTLRGLTTRKNYSSLYPNGGTVNIVESRPQIETNPINYEDRAILTIPDVAAAVSASVVEIKTESAVYDKFYGSYVSEGAGSGVIITESGFIITNNHVISGASTITVTLSNGKEYPATLIGADSESDIAVISISPSVGETLTPAVLGRSNSLVLGESVVVIGNPLGSLGGSVTNGIISSLDREIIIDGETMTLIQTNAAVNPGNSGGGMFNMYGELVAIINAKSSGENIEGIGFAIPIDHAYSIASQLVEFGYVKGKVDHGFTLIEISDIWDMAKYNVSSTGVYIFSSAYSEEFNNGDLITQFNGVKIQSLSDIKLALNGCKVGDEVSVTVVRNRRTVNGTLILHEYTPSTNK